MKDKNSIKNTKKVDCDGVKVLNRENNWMATFETLSVSAMLGGANHQYIIKEVGETANTILIDGEQYQVVYGGSMEDGFSITNQKETPIKLSTPMLNDPDTNKPWITNISTNKTYIAQKMKHATMAGVVNKSSNKVLPKTGGGESNTSHQYVWLMLLLSVIILSLTEEALKAITSVSTAVEMGNVYEMFSLW